MRASLKTLLVSSVLAAGLGLTLAGRATAQTFTTLYSFSAAFGSGTPTNGDGADPLPCLILSDNVLYGTTFDGGSSGWGTVFAINVHGTGFTNLHSFTAAPS